MISVVMPAYNAARFLRPAVESILNQTYRDFEFIIVDDGSTDSTTDILREYAARDSRVRLIAGEHTGIPNALNKGIAAARYDWIGRMDADDIALPTRFEQQLRAAAAQPQVVAWGSYVQHINSAGEILSLSPVGPTTLEEFYRQRERGDVICISHPSALLRKDALLKAGGYDPQFSTAEDIEMLNRLAQQGPILALTEPLLLYRVHTSSISMQGYFLQRKLAGYVQQLNKEWLKGNLHFSLDDYLYRYDHTPPPVRLLRQLDDRARFHYRKAGLSYGENRYAAMIANLGIAALLNPSYTTARLWRQMLRPQLAAIMS